LLLRLVASSKGADKYGRLMPLLRRWFAGWLGMRRSLCPSPKGYIGLWAIRLSLPETSS
jgi:hypothetical protein